MAALRFAARRAAELVALLAVLSFVVFSLLYLAPGDPAKSLVGTRKATPELLEQIRATYHLGDPYLVQYGRWLGDLVRGDLGTSLRTGLSVTEMIGTRLGLTLQLAGLAFVLSLVIGLPLGIAAARRHGRLRDRAITGAAVAGVSAPSFAVGLVLLYLFAVTLGWFPVYGAGKPGLDRLRHFALPSLALALGLAAMVVKVTRAALIRELHRDYGDFLRARGAGPAAVLRAQVTNAAIPILTSSGLLLASLFGGAILVEDIFAVGGVGQLLADSITFKDTPVVQALTLIIAVLICLTTAVVDGLVLLIDPRLRRAAA